MAIRELEPRIKFKRFELGKKPGMRLDKGFTTIDGESIKMGDEEFAEIDIEQNIDPSSGKVVGYSVIVLGEDNVGLIKYIDGQGELVRCLSHTEIDRDPIVGKYICWDFLRDAAVDLDVA